MNIIIKLKNGQHITLDKVESICRAMNCDVDDILEFLQDNSVSGHKRSVISQAKDDDGVL